MRAGVPRAHRVFDHLAGFGLLNKQSSLAARELERFVNEERIRRITAQILVAACRDVLREQAHIVAHAGVHRHAKDAYDTLLRVLVRAFPIVARFQPIAWCVGTQCDGDTIIHAVDPPTIPGDVHDAGFTLRVADGLGGALRSWRLLGRSRLPRAQESFKLHIVELG